jgi:hypothetical protein
MSIDYAFITPLLFGFIHHETDISVVTYDCRYIV